MKILNVLQCFARIERGQGVDLGKRALPCAVYHFEGTFTRGFTFLAHNGKNTIFDYLKRKQYYNDQNVIQFNI